jgi:hypothetical protein
LNLVEMFLNFSFVSVLKCLEIILEDESKALEDDCKQKLRQRIEMFKNAANVSLFS